MYSTTTTTCTGVSYWLDNVGCVNQAVGEACFKDAGCQSEECIGGTCASQESPNCAQVNAAGACIHYVLPMPHLAVRRAHQTAARQAKCL